MPLHLTITKNGSVSIFAHIGDEIVVLPVVIDVFDNFSARVPLWSVPVLVAAICFAMQEGLVVKVRVYALMGRSAASLS